MVSTQLISRAAYEADVLAKRLAPQLRTEGQAIQKASKQAFHKVEDRFGDQALYQKGKAGLLGTLGKIKTHPLAQRALALLKDIGSNVQTHWNKLVVQGKKPPLESPPSL